MEHKSCSHKHPSHPQGQKFDFFFLGRNEGFMVGQPPNLTFIDYNPEGWLKLDWLSPPLEPIDMRPLQGIDHSLMRGTKLVPLGFRKPTHSSTLWGGVPNVIGHHGGLANSMTFTPSLSQRLTHLHTRERRVCFLEKKRAIIIKKRHTHTLIYALAHNQESTHS